MKMKAALMYGPNDIRVEETEKPECPKDGLILKIMSVGLCGSDIRNLTTDSRKGAYPFIYGHEIVGFVDEIGSEETKYNVSAVTARTVPIQQLQNLPEPAVLPSM